MYHRGVTGEDDDWAEAEAAAAPTMKSFGDAELLRRPTAAQIRDAVDATPTLEDRRPDIEIPSYFTKDDSGRLSGAVAKASDPAPEEDAAGFTEAVDHDVTLAEPASSKRQGALLWVALGLAAAAVALALLLTGCATGAVAPHTRPELAPTEGLVLIAVDTNEPLQGLVFTLRGSHEGFVVRSAEAGVSGYLLQVPVGEYMLSDLRTTYAVFDSSQQRLANKKHAPR